MQWVRQRVDQGECYFSKNPAHGHPEFPEVRVWGHWGVCPSRVSPTASASCSVTGISSAVCPIPHGCYLLSGGSPEVHSSLLPRQRDRRRKVSASRGTGREKSQTCQEHTALLSQDHQASRAVLVCPTRSLCTLGSLLSRWDNGLNRCQS